MQSHRDICYESTKPSVAKVDASGLITAVGPGKCTVYVFAQDGRYTSCKVTVK
ncbi:MAG: Ig-like domain-containing protein [Lachnospiraceae bacterium]|nr:Ig-like domain-containing protein [Lachnospiraceae bacterium]